MQHRMKDFELSTLVFFIPFIFNEFQIIKKGIRKEMEVIDWTRTTIMIHAEMGGQSPKKI